MSSQFWHSFEKTTTENDRMNGVGIATDGGSEPTHPGVQPVYDSDQALDGPPRELVWDAWSRTDWREVRQITRRVTHRVSRPWGGLRINQVRTVSDSDDNPIAEYQYDGQTRRTLSLAGGVTRHFYYDDQWRSVEERLDSAATAERQHAWNPADRWDLILRDRSTANNGVMGERLYCMKDDLDPVAVCDPSGSVVERYAYTAFGVPLFMNSAYGSEASSSVDWNVLFHVEFADAETGWMNYGYRYYVPELGRWLNRDPIEERSGSNLYGMVNNDPINHHDLLGAIPCHGNALRACQTRCGGNPRIRSCDGTLIDLGRFGSYWCFVRCVCTARCTFLNSREPIVQPGTVPTPGPLGMTIHHVKECRYRCPVSGVIYRYVPVGGTCPDTYE